jgi:hypothetical protein
MVYYVAHYASFPEFLLCTLCLDAFTVDPNSPKPRRETRMQRGTESGSGIDDGRIIIVQCANLSISVSRAYHTYQKWMA